MSRPDLLTESDYVNLGDVERDVALIADDPEAIVEYVSRAYRTGLVHGVRSARRERGGISIIEEGFAGLPYDQQAST